MRQNDPELHFTRLETELRALCRGFANEEEVREALHSALRDLAGSVSRDSMPEMASRLAATRLGERPARPAKPKIPVAV